jgi:beta-glucosidase
MMSMMQHALALFAFASLASGLISQPDFAGDANRIQNLQARSIEARDDVPAGFVAAPYYPSPPGGVSYILTLGATYSPRTVTIANVYDCPKSF